MGMLHLDMVHSAVSTDAHRCCTTQYLGGICEEVPMDAPRLQLVVAHPDDETFGCGSLLLHAAAAGATTSVVCATRGEAGEGGAADLGAVREQELRAAARLLGVQR